MQENELEKKTKSTTIALACTGLFQETRRIGKSEWQDLERTDMRQFCDFHSTEQQILANPELQEARGVHAGAH